jgi:hypothetical protein
MKRNAQALWKDALGAVRDICNASLARKAVRIVPLHTMGHKEVNHVAVYIARLSLIWSHNPQHHH